MSVFHLAVAIAWLGLCFAAIRENVPAGFFVGLVALVAMIRSRDAERARRLTERPIATSGRLVMVATSAGVALLLVGSGAIALTYPTWLAADAWLLVRAWLKMRLDRPGEVETVMKISAASGSALALSGLVFSPWVVAVLARRLWPEAPSLRANRRLAALVIVAWSVATLGLIGLTVLPEVVEARNRVEAQRSRAKGYDEAERLWVRCSDHARGDDTRCDRCRGLSRETVAARSAQAGLDARREQHGLAIQEADYLASPHHKYRHIIFAAIVLPMVVAWPLASRLRHELNGAKQEIRPEADQDDATFPEKSR